MQYDKTLDDLIEAGWNVVNTEYDQQAYYLWKKKAHDFLADFVGPDHEFTRGIKAGFAKTDSMLTKKENIPHTDNYV